MPPVRVDSDRMETALTEEQKKRYADEGRCFRSSDAARVARFPAHAPKNEEGRVNEH